MWADARRCRLPASSRARPRWSSCSPWAWRTASPRPSARSMPSSPRIRWQPGRSTRIEDHGGSEMTDTTTLTSPIPGAEAHTLDAPGATLVYDLRRSDTATEPPLVLIGSPMGAGGFPSLAEHFPDRTLVSYDPRNNGERSIADDPAAPITPEVQADDVHRIIEEVGGAPVDLFASSGGAIVTLALVAKYPNDVRTAVAHEPPLAALVPDREHAVAACQAINATYHRSGSGAEMDHF